MFRSNGLSPQRPSLSYQFRLCVEKKTGFRPPSASRWMLRLISALPTTSMTGRVQLFKGSAALCAAADALPGLRLERALPQSAVSDLVSTVASALGCSPEAASLDLFLRAASSPRLLELPPLVTVELQLGLLVALAPVSDVSLWSGGPLGELGCLVHVGEAQPTRRVRKVAQATLEGVPDGGVSERGWIHSV